MQNKTLAQSDTNGVEVHLFEVLVPTEYIYRGIVSLADKPYQEIQKGEDGVSYWEISDGKISNILHTNVGYQALLKILCDILKEVPMNQMDDKKVYEDYLVKAKSIDWQDAGDEKRYPFTSSSIKTLYEDIKQKVF